MLAAALPLVLPGWTVSTVLVMKAWARQANHARGELFASVVGVLSRQNRHGPPSHTRDAYGVFEVGAALTLSRSAAHDLSELAWDLATRLPQVLAALRAGELDQAKAAVFATYTLSLPDEQAQTIVAELLARAPGWTVGQLRDGRPPRHRPGPDGRRVVAHWGPAGAVDATGTPTLAGYS